MRSILKSGQYGKRSLFHDYFAASYADAESRCIKAGQVITKERPKK